MASLSMPWQSLSVEAVPSPLSSSLTRPVATWPPGFFWRDRQISDSRSSEAREWRRLYASKQWATLRRQALTRDGFKCQRCGVILTDGRRSPRSAVVHHIEAHKGNAELFFDLANLEAVCWTCHSGAIQSEEVLGYDATIGPDGWPVDPKHPGAK